MENEFKQSMMDLSNKLSEALKKEQEARNSDPSNPKYSAEHQVKQVISKAYFANRDN